MNLYFTKMEGLGNDYIYIDGVNQDVPINEKRMQQWSDRHFGIGSDGVIVILPSKQYDFTMRMFNQDGSEGRMCGNGIRCFAKFCYDHHLTEKQVLDIETKAGLRKVELVFEEDIVIGAKVDMGKPVLQSETIPIVYNKDTMVNESLEVGDTKYIVTALSMGNPHIVTFVDNLDISLDVIGPLFEHHPIFPESVNTEFVQVINDSYIKMRVWERGSGETMACGTGACAAMYASYINGYIKKQATVELLGGTLDITYENQHVYMCGPTTTVFEGKIKL